ncbi:hypothetical protein LUZ60_001198 [Juncus effusus]|nr:hypothetical protein LUZ60_001198 [Juncus effusus]
MASSSSTGFGSGAPFRSRFGDTTYTKVFVGGLAWETPTEELHKYFAQFGDILESVIITDRFTGRSKGYGFVTFRDPESARRSVADPNPFIDGRRANCNIASMGRPKASPPPRENGAYTGRFQTGDGYQGPHSHAIGGPYNMRFPGQLPTQPPVLYPPQYAAGYFPYTSDYAYQQQAYYNPQMIAQYYQQMYGPTSTPTPGPSPYPFSPMGYLPAVPRPGYQSTHQGQQQPYIQYPTAQIDGSNFASSLPPNFQLQLPPRTRHQRSNTIDSEESQQASQPGPNAESQDP